MAVVLKNLNIFSKSYLQAPVLFNSLNQVRFKWADWRMKKDARKRNTLKEHAIERLRINSLRKNDILPPELREIADQEIAALPVDSSLTRVVFRCSITSRPRATVKRYRVSRIIFRHLADYNKLSFVQRAMW